VAVSVPGGPARPFEVRPSASPCERGASASGLSPAGAWTRVLPWRRVRSALGGCGLRPVVALRGAATVGAGARAASRAATAIATRRAASRNAPADAGNRDRDLRSPRPPLLVRCSSSTRGALPMPAGKVDGRGVKRQRGASRRGVTPDQQRRSARQCDELWFRCSAERHRRCPRTSVGARARNQERCVARIPRHPCRHRVAGAIDGEQGAPRGVHGRRGDRNSWLPGAGASRHRVAHHGPSRHSPDREAIPGWVERHTRRLGTLAVTGDVRQRGRGLPGRGAGGPRGRRPHPRGHPQARHPLAPVMERSASATPLSDAAPRISTTVHDETFGGSDREQR
jgi:hypothetical protein